MTNTTAALLIAVNDAKLQITSRNYRETIQGLRDVALSSGRADIAKALDVDHALAYDALGTLAIVSRRLRDELRATA